MCFYVLVKTVHDNSNNYANKENLAVICPIKNSVSVFGTFDGESISVPFLGRKCKLLYIAI